jgi:hypothetical protein
MLTKLMKKMLHSDKNLTVSILIVMVGVITFGVSVLADSASTSVTVSNATPAISATTLNAGSAITLTENTTKTVYATTTVTDGNGCSTISSVKADLYRSAVGASSCDTAGEADDNHCYPRVTCTVVGGTCTGGTDTAANYLCTFSLQYFADPTDSGAYSAQNWVVNIEAGDGAATSTDATTAVELNSLAALDVTASITYGTMSANSDTGATNSTTTVTNTGNTNIDPDISGTDMASGGDTLTVDNQEYSASNFTYGAGTNLSTTPTSVDITLPQRTSSEITDIVLWGIGIPAGTPNGSYTGTNTFTAVAN